MPTSVGPNTFGEENLVFGYDLGDVANSYKGQPTVNHIADLGDPTEERARGEFGQYFNLVPIFETYGLVPYTLSMEIKGNIPGSCLVYMQNGSYTKYGFVSTWVGITTEWQRFVFSNITPSGPTAAWQANTPGDNRAMLATYTIYGSGRNPTIRNVQLERSAHVTPFTAGTRSATQGLIDLKGTSTIDLSNVSFDSNAQMTFDGTNDYASLGTVPLRAGASTYTIEAVFRADSTKTQVIWEQNSSGVTQHQRACMILLSNGYGGFNGQSNDFHSAVPYSTGVWYHWIITVDKNLGTNPIKVYVNGTLYAQGDSSAGASNLNVGTYGAATGYKLNANGEYFDGDIKLVKVYNRVLTSAEASANYRAIKGRFNI